MNNTDTGLVATMLYVNVKDSCEIEVESAVERAIHVAGYSVIILVSMIGNTLLICAVQKNNRLNAITHLLIVNMAVADIPVTVCNMPGRLIRQITRQYHWFDGIPGIVVCKFASFNSESTVSCPILTLTVIALERFCLVTFQFKKIITIKIVKFLILAIWLASFLSMSPLLYAMTTLEIDGIVYCYEDWSPLFDQETAAKAYAVISFVLLYTVPLLIILQGLDLPSVSCQSLTEISGDRRSQENLKMLIVVVVVFALCWLPLHTSLFLYFFQADEYLCGIPQSGFSIGSIGLFLSHTTSAINPCLDMAFNKDIRNGFQNILLSCCCLCNVLRCK